MPYLWTPAHHAPLPPIPPAQDHSDSAAQGGQGGTQTDRGEPILRLEIWPHRSLPSKGFAAAIWLMFVAGLVPVVPFIGTTAFWVLLLCMLSVLAALWIALRKSDRDLLREELLIWHDRITLTHWTSKGARFDWVANPYWVKLTLTPNGKVEQYLTLKGGGPISYDTETTPSEATREVELGAFLSPEERQTLRGDLELVLGRLRQLQ
ncbi:DUF2244 domain-containing protein [Celeribacter sp.]|uniref:DUF2244 domain-containing protein n=1 Tax=Celeribacter sp. TaxID=1890673 RepID=UPI003A9027CA